MNLGKIRHRGDLSLALDAAVEFGLDRVKQQLSAAGFKGADLFECVAAERKRLVRWREEVEIDFGEHLPDAPTPAADAA